MTKATGCSVEGCERKHQARGWCAAHYNRWRQDGDPGPADFRAVTPGGRACEVDDCEGRARVKGLCHAHYRRIRETGEAGGPIRRRQSGRPDKKTGPCSVVDCSRVEAIKGMCRGHYQRWWAQGDPGPADFRPMRPAGPCEVTDCERPRRHRTYCDLHYRRLRRGVAIDSLNFNSQPKPADPDSYAAVHGRLRRTRGNADSHPCFWCGDQADAWAYQHNDREALQSPGGHPYSLKLDQCYQPMCRPCHGQFDRDLDARIANL